MKRIFWKERRKENSVGFFGYLLIIFLLLVLAGCQFVSTRKSEPFLLFTGEGLAEEVKLTLSQLKALQEGLVEEEYFSINSFGTREYTHFKGIWVWHILEERLTLKEDASTILFIAEDGYQTQYTLEEVKREDYIHEEDPKRRYKMILAFEEEGKEYDPEKGNPFRLVRGQKEPGEANKPYWVFQVKTIEIQ